jgi:fatty acid desaturase
MTTLSTEPAIQSPVRRGSDFSALSRQVRAARLLDRRYWHYTVRIAVTLLACAAAWAGLVLLSGSWFELLVAAGLGIVSTQIGFLGHDAAHQQIAASLRRDQTAPKATATTAEQAGDNGGSCAG